MDFETARTKMVDNQIRTTDVTDWRILRAFLTVPRQDFVPAERKPLSYIDGDVSLGGGRYVMEASPLAKLVQLSGVRDSDRVLVVGCATGYTAAILSHLAAAVVALEEDGQLASAARAALSRIAAQNCSVVDGSLVGGCADRAPFDVIFVDGAVEALPTALCDQLADKGRLVVVEGLGNAAAARLYVRDGGSVSSRFAFNCSVRPLPGFQKKAEFVF